MSKASCEKHPFEMAASSCYDCGHAACEDCLVFARGPEKPPICMECSVAAAGIRSSAARPAKYSGREMRQLQRRLVAELKESRRLSPSQEREPALYDVAATMDDVSWIDDKIDVPATESAAVPAWKQSWGEGWDEPVFAPGT